ncbi:MAG TPA: electron transfer flavoprotein subunit beta/FixA family protein [Thermomicrobiales bacterium]|nr:electron transfer flavoprotein subunit beta/FixA family protein [Thermomicrobiales bacterium]
MNIVCCVKQVPDPNTVVYQVDPGTKRLVRTGVPNVLDPGAEVALEEALRLAERTPDSAVTVLSMGPETATEAIRRALAMGANEGALVTDPALAGSDTLGTARALAAAIKQQPFDIVFCATESTDGYSGMVPGMVAEFLGIPLLSFVRKIEIEGGVATAQRVTAHGYQVITCTLPAVVTIASGTNEPRYPPLKGIMQAKRKQVQTYDLAALGLSPSDAGEAGARERVLALQAAEERGAGEIIEDDGSGATRIADFLQQRGII